MATDIMCMSDDKRGTLKLFTKRLHAVPDTEFFGLIRSADETLPKEVLSIYQEAASTASLKNQASPEPIFESALQKLNGLLSPYLEQKKNLQLIFGLKSKNRILFSACGDIMAIFIEKRERGDISVSPLGQMLHDEEDRFFGHFAGGAIESHQSVFFAPREMNTYFTPIRVATTLLSSPNGLWQLKEALAGYDAALPFGAIHILPTRRDASAPLISMETLTATETQTDKILTPPLLPDIRTLVNKQLAAVSDQFKSFLGWTRERLPAWRQSLADMLARFNQRRNRITLPSADSLRRSVSTIRLRQFRLPEMSLDHAVAYFNRLPMGAKTLSIFFAVALVVFLQSLAYLKLTAGARAESQKLAGQVEQIQNNLSQMRAIFLYGDEVKGKSLLEETERLFAGIAGARSLKKETRDSIIGEIDRAKSVLRREVPLTLSELYAFGEQKRPAALAILGGNVYLAGENSLLKLNAEKKTADVLYQNLNLKFSEMLVNQDAGSILLIDKEKDAMAEIFVQKNTNSQDNLPVHGGEVFASYGKRMYAIGGSPKSVYRMTRLDGKLVANTWLTRSADVSNITDMAIDGEIYALTGSGAVRKFSGGAAKNFSLEAVEPPIQSGQKILAPVDEDRLYILESGKNRILAYTKKGVFTAQYLIPDSGSILDFALDEAGKNFFLLTERGVFSAPAGQRQ